VDIFVPVTLSDWGALLMSGHVVSVRLYVTIFLALLLLTGLTTGVAFIDLGPYNTVAALAIAFVKMLLVVLFFMHVRYSSGLTKIVCWRGFFWWGFLFRFCFLGF